MKYLLPPLLGLSLVLISLLCPIIVPFALLFVKWDDKPTYDHIPCTDAPPVIRGDLPGWLDWLSTPDERLPGGMYEPQVRAVYERFGRYVCSWYWLGIRNRILTLSTWVGKRVTDKHVVGLGFWEGDGIWWYAKQLGPFKFVTGYQTYKVLDGTFWAAPTFTLKYRPVKAN